VVKRWLAALVVAAAVTVGLAAPGAAQSCGDFASQKDAQRHLEQVGDGGGLDPDGNGYACDGVAFGGGGSTVINSDGPVASNSAGGVSGTTTVVNNPGARAERAAPGTGNQTRERRDRSDRGDRNNGGGGEPAGVAAEPDAGGAPVDGGALGQEVAAPSGAAGAPIQLPNTGTGRAATPYGAALAFLLAALAALSWGVGRRAPRT
jgi:hypothetical protein